ncbi:Uncharacterised protein at_DN2294 [Pycnogonum litorale]
MINLFAATGHIHYGGLTRGRGVTESVRTTWINSMHRCTAIHNSMSTLTNVIHRTSEQHVDLTASRRQRDMADMEKLDAWFQTHDPFNPDIPTLRSLSTGLTAGESDINCDDAEVVGQMIQKKLDGVCFEVVTIRSDQVRTLESLQVGVKVDKTVIHIDPLILFTRATLLLERQDQEEQINNFKFEFTPEPSALFKNDSMRKTQKSELRNSIICPQRYSLQLQNNIQEYVWHKIVQLQEKRSGMSGCL